MRINHYIIAFVLAAVCFSGCQTISSVSPESAVNHELSMNQEYPLPEIPPAKLFQHPIPAKLQLNNGMEVWYIENPIVGLMSFRVMFNRGASSDPFDKSGLSSLTAAMLKEGANGLSAQQISDDIEFIGASLSPDVSQDGSVITLQVMTQFFDQALDIFDNIWLKPDFTADSFERLKKILINGLKQRSDSPDEIARLASNREYFGENHPYSRSADGYVDTIQNITLEDVKNNYKDVFSPNRAAIIAVGSMPADEFMGLLNQHFGQLPYSKAERVDIKADIPEAKLRLTIVDKPNAPQTVIRIYQPAIDVSSVDTLFWQLVNIPVGGSFTSRLNQNIREDKGYSYGVRSGYAPQKYASLQMSVSSVGADVTGAALKEFLYELERVPKGDFTQEEFERARETWKSELVQSFETQAGSLATISGIYKNEKPMNFINTFARHIDEITLDQFNQFARTYPKIDQMSITLVGDKNLILEQIKDLNLPAPTFRDVEGKLVQ